MARKAVVRRTVLFEYELDETSLDMLHPGKTDVQIELDEFDLDIEHFIHAKNETIGFGLKFVEVDS